MNCQEFLHNLDDLIDGYVEPHEAVKLRAHLENCQDCQASYQEQQALRNQLRRLPLPEPRAGFVDRVLATAIQQGKVAQTAVVQTAVGQHGRAHVQAKVSHVHHHRIGFIKGFSTALAAGLALWVVVSIFPVQRGAGIPQPSQQALAQGVTITVQQVQTVTLAFQTVSALDNARITIRLPENVEIVGYEGRNELAWNTNLKKGDNILKLPIKANTLMNGRIVAEIVHANQSKTIGIDVQVKKPELTMEPLDLNVV